MSETNKKVQTLGQFIINNNNSHNNNNNNDNSYVNETEVVEGINKAVAKVLEGYQWTIVTAANK